MKKKVLIPVFASVVLLSTNNIVNADKINDEVNLNDQNNTSVIVLDEYIEKQFSVATVKEGVAVKVRKDGRVINVAYTGDKLRILGTQGEWIEVFVDEGISGWIPKRYVDIEKSEAYITGETVNFRKEDNTDSEIIKELVIGTELKVLEVSDEWVKVQKEENEGFVSAKFLSEDAPIIEVEEEIIEEESIEDETVEEQIMVASEEVEETVEEEVEVEEEIQEEVTEPEVAPEPEVVEPVVPEVVEPVVPEVVEPVVPEVVEPEVVEPVAPPVEVVPEVVEPVVPEVVEPEVPASNTSSVQAVLNLAYSKQGLPYKWGAEGPNSFDCSGFTSYVFRNAVGVNLPRTSSAQSTFGTTVSKANLQPGDLVFFGSSASNVSHVGIYVGGGNMIHSPSSGKNISTTSIHSNYYSGRFITAKRVL